MRAGRSASSSSPATSTSSTATAKCGHEPAAVIGADALILRTPYLGPQAAADYAHLRIGLLGGSFNPAHEGHRHISLLALKHLGLDELWWLVSPQNPLKSSDGMAPFEERFKSAIAASRHPRIRVTDIESHLGTRYTADTLAAFAVRFPKTRFVWIMGADNLRQISAWKNWTTIFRTVPVAVFDRAPYAWGALASHAAQRFRRYRLPARRAAKLALMVPPAWVFFHSRLHPASATAIRTGRRRQRSAAISGQRR
jgi:nicotinate-nucleotide adenylyltransferase